MTMIDSIGIYDTNVTLWAECNPAVNKDRLWREYRSVLARLGARGWSVRSDPEVDEHYPTLSRTTRIAHRGDMRIGIELRGRCIKTEVYLDAVIDNPHGHRYDFRRLSHMNGEQRLRCILAMTAVVRKGFELGYVLGPKLARRFELHPTLPLLVRDLAEQRTPMNPLDAFNEVWNSEHDWARSGRFERDETGWPAVHEYDAYGRNVDHDGVPLRNGQTRYIRDPRTHRLIRGTVYTNMNEMWMLDTGVGRCWKHRSELFSSVDPSAEPRRVVPKQAERLEREIERAMKAKDFLRLATLGRVRASMESAA